MNLALLLIGSYFLAGAWVAWAVDHVQMKSHVPYAELPSLVPLRYIRILVVSVLILCGPVYAVQVTAGAVRRVFSHNRAVRERAARIRAIRDGRKAPK